MGAEDTFRVYESDGPHMIKVEEVIGAVDETGHEWLIGLKTRRAMPAIAGGDEKGFLTAPSPPILDLPEMIERKQIIKATDENGHEWWIDLETRKAFPAIAGGDDSPVPPDDRHNYCYRHRQARLEYLYDKELDNNFGVALMYCHVMECDFVEPRAIGLEPGPLDAKKNKLLLMTAARQKVFFKKFVEHLVSNGK